MSFATIIGCLFNFMFFSKIYMQKNFVPNIVQDQFGREVIGIEISLNEGEDLEVAREQGQAYIKDYIQKNTVYPDHDHIEETVIPNIQVARQELDEALTGIGYSQSIADLEGYKIFVKNKPVLQAAYDVKYKQLLKKQNS